MDWYETKFKSTGETYRYTVAHWCATEARFRNHLRKVKKDELPKLISLDNMLVRITQQDVVYRRYLVPEHRAYVPDFGVYIKVQGDKGVEYRALSRQLVLFCVERRKAWRLLQSKAGIDNKEYRAQRALLAVAEANRGILIPGYTHLQRAQPVGDEAAQVIDQRVEGFGVESHVLPNSVKPCHALSRRASRDKRAKPDIRSVMD